MLSVLVSGQVLEITNKIARSLDLLTECTHLIVKQNLERAISRTTVLGQDFMTYLLEQPLMLYHKYLVSKYNLPVQ